MLRLLFIFALWIGWSSYQPIRGKSTAPSILLMVDFYKRVDYMKKKKTLTQLLREFQNVHKGKYLYEKVNDGNYKNNKSKIPVVCKEHGEFLIIVDNHLRGQGCPTCANIKRRLSNTGNIRKRTKLVYGFGVNDYDGNIKNHIHIPSYHTWVEMLKRCNCDSFKYEHTSYINCRCCEEWKSFNAFKEWFDNPENGYMDGYCLDKDILFKGNKFYSPETCCFVPNEINVLLCKCDSKRGKMPIGVYERKLVNGNSYLAYLNKNGCRINIGTFYSIKEAFQAYKSAKEAHIQEVGKQYYQEGKITKKVYDALLNYKVEITD